MVPSGDDLTIILFLVGTGLMFGVSAMTAAGWRHPVLIFGLFGLGALFFAAGIGWPFVKTISPPASEIVRQVAVSPAAWFCVLVLGLAAALLYRRGQPPSVSAPVAAKRQERRWYTYSAIRLLAAPELQTAATSNAENVREAQRKYDEAMEGFKHFAIAGLDSMMSKEWMQAKSRADTLHEELRMQRKHLSASHRRVMDYIYKQLQEGTFVARAFLTPVNKHPEQIIIPAAQWRFLRFNDDLSEASGQDITYTMIDVARA